MNNDSHSLKSMVEALKVMGTRVNLGSPGYGELNSVVRKAEDLVVVATSKTADTPERRAQRISAGRDHYLRAVGAATNAHETRARGARAQLRQDFAAAIGLEADRYANSIVEAFARASQSDKTAMLSKVVETGDGRSLAALMEAPSFVTGVPRDMLNQFTQAMEAKHTPEIHARRQKLESALQEESAILSHAANIAEQVAGITDLEQTLKESEEMSQAEQRLATG